MLDNPWHRERAWLGYAGLFPFAAALVALAGATDPAARDLAVDVMRYYAAVIASFLGAVHWGVAVLELDMRRARLRWGVMPALIAWTLLLVPPTAALPGFVVLFAAILYVDWQLLPLPDEHYRPLRAQLSAGVILMLTVASLLLGGSA
jgi:hypothetical protein